MQTNLESRAVSPGPEECLDPTYYFDYRHESVARWIAANVSNDLTRVEKAVRIYYLVRDGWRYNPYGVSTVPEKIKASYLLTQKHGYCTTKAILVATFARAIGIPSRLGFGDVRNHLSSPRLIEYLKSELFTWHGFTELYLNNKWVRCTPAFDAALCKKFKVVPLEFDGEHDSLFQDFDTAGHKFMEYVSYRGVYADLPYQEMFDSLAEYYPHLFEEWLAEK